MTDSGRHSGSGIAELFRLAADHATILSGLTGETAAAANADKAYTIGGDKANSKILIVEDIAYDENGIPTVKFTQTGSGEDFKAFQKIAFPHKKVAASDTLEELKSECGDKIGGEADTTNRQLFVLFLYGAPGITDSKVEVHAIPGYFKYSSGSKSREYMKFEKPSLEFVGVAAKETDDTPSTGIVIAKALLNSAIVTIPETPATYEIAPDYYEESFFLAKAV